jgi:hypothetical protein
VGGRQAVQESRQVGLRRGEAREELGEGGRVGQREAADRVQRGEDLPLLVERQLDELDRNRRLAPGDCLLDPQMAVDDMARDPVDDYLPDSADAVEHRTQGAPLGLGVEAPVLRVGHERLGLDLGVADDAVSPR